MVVRAIEDRIDSMSEDEGGDEDDEECDEMIRQLIREMLLQEKNLMDVLGLGPKISQEIDVDVLKGGGHEYPKDKPTLDFRRDKKKLWNRYADHSYFQNPKRFFVYHYLGHYSSNKRLEDYFPRASTKPGRVPGIDFANKDELSCFGSQAWPGVDQGDLVQLLMPFFTFKKYRVTFASVEDASTEWLSKATMADVEKHKASGLPKRPYVYLNYREIPLDEEEVEEQGLEEVVIDNWIIDTFYCEEYDVEYAKELGLKYKVMGR